MLEMHQQYANIFACESNSIYTENGYESKKIIGYEILILVMEIVTDFMFNKYCCVLGNQHF